LGYTLRSTRLPLRRPFPSGHGRLWIVLETINQDPFFRYGDVREGTRKKYRELAVKSGRGRRRVPALELAERRMYHANHAKNTWRDRIVSDDEDNVFHSWPPVLAPETSVFFGCFFWFTFKEI